MKNVFKPEFLNRLDSTVVFHALTRQHIREVVDILLRDVEKQLMAKGVHLEVTEKAKDWLGDKGYDPTFGARPLRRVIQNEIEGPSVRGAAAGAVCHRRQYRHRRRGRQARLQRRSRASAGVTRLLAPIEHKAKGRA